MEILNIGFTKCPVYIRTSPIVKPDNILCSFNRDQEVHVTGETEDFYQIAIDGKLYYVMKQFIKIVEKPDEKVEAEDQDIPKKKSTRKKVEDDA